MHSLGLRADGTVMAWGNNYYGAASPPASATNIQAIATGSSFSLALREDGTLLLWGQSHVPVPPDATNILAISATVQHALAIRDDGRVIAWGDDSLGLTNVPAALAFPSAVAAGGCFDLALLDPGPLRFRRQPGNRTVAAGNAVALSGWAIGPGPLSYQWLRNGTNVSGATHGYLKFDDLQAAAADDYALVATGTQGSITSEVAVVTVLPSPPTITLQPVSQLAGPGGSAALSASAKGTEPLTYQWRLNGINLPGATSTSLTFTNAQWLT